jgi:acetyl-CoA carboxylase biotin carboxylase subunit
MSFETVLIANRGEIALRVIEACRELGLRSIIVYSEADASMPYLKLADASVCIGPAEPAKSYLSIASIISAVELTNARAIHPGYGFLAENPHFVEVCEEHGLTFIGPSSETMRLVGNKLAAREAVSAAGVPTLPAAPAPEDPDELLEVAEGIGCPLLVKAVYGGGGRGMRFVSSLDEVAALATAARAEAKTACGDGSLYLEKAVESPRHVEVQIFADAQGSVVHLGERDCSIQRRHQKMIEESPAPRLEEELRRRLHEAAIRAARVTGYRNAGTVEFLVGGDGGFHFVEMNARIQVEHSVTEVVTGTNLIKQQIRVAMGEPLPFAQEEIEVRGHAIECRVTAENPERDFTPSCGTAQVHELPGGNGVRLDTALYDGMGVSPHYDSLLAKLMTWGWDRDEACARMLTALGRFRVSGVATTCGFLHRIVSDPAFRRGEVTTGLVERILSQDD